MNPYIHKVQYYETDRMQITHHSNYIRFMEEARVDFLEQIGWGYDRLEAEGISSPVVSVSCEYKKSTTFADKIEVAVRVTDVSPVRLRLSYTMTAGGAVVCTAESAHCFLNESGRPTSLKKQQPEFYECLLHLLCEGGA